jgi:hypothetical protein
MADNKPPPSLLNQPSTPTERTREALRNIASPPQPEDPAFEQAHLRKLPHLAQRAS